MNIQNVGPIQNTVYHSGIRTSAVKNVQSKYADSGAVLNSLSFLGNYNTPSVKKSIDNPIKDDKEFNEVMERVYDAKTESGNTLWLSRNYRDIFVEYKNATEIEMGLIPYCGWVDHSDLINMYLSGRTNKKECVQKYNGMLPQNEESYVDVIRALDYSLKNLDKEFGAYKGIVYRKGYMDEGNGQYFSTTKDPKVILQRSGIWNDFKSKGGYSVIRLKNGHKIYAFQEKMDSDFADDEAEVLTSRNSKFKKVAPEDMDEELLKGAEELAKNLFYGADNVVSGEWNSPMSYNKGELLNLIDVYEEV